MIALFVEILVLVLLVATIGFSIMLDRRLRLLRADDAQIRKTIAEFAAAMDMAERASANLKGLVASCDRSLEASLREAEQRGAELAEQIRCGDDVIARIARIVETVRMADANAAPAKPAGKAATPEPRLAGTLAAAQAFASRARQRAGEQAA